jgi:hypothetical protein
MAAFYWPATWERRNGYAYESPRLELRPASKEASPRSLHCHAFLQRWATHSSTEKNKCTKPSGRDHAGFQSQAEGEAGRGTCRLSGSRAYTAEAVRRKRQRGVASGRPGNTAEGLPQTPGRTCWHLLSKTVRTKAAVGEEHQGLSSGEQLFYPGSIFTWCSSPARS